jgi:hypothetical protein
MKALIKIVCVVVVAFVFSTVQAPASMLAWDTSGHGSPVDTTLTASTIDPGIGNSPALSRVEIIGAPTGNAFASSGWNNTATFLQNNRYMTFTLVASAPITLETLAFAGNGSATGARNYRWGYSVNGGAFTFSSDYLGSQVVQTFTWDFTDVPLSATDSVEFRFWSWGAVGINGGAASTGGTFRIPGNGNIDANGNDLILTYSVIPEPSTMALIGFGLVGLLAFARRHRS